MSFLDLLARRALAWRIRYGFYHWDAARLRSHQQQRLAHMLAWVSHHSPYYRDLRAQGWDGTLETLPVMRKTELVANFDRINSAGLRKADLVDFAIQNERAREGERARWGSRGQRGALYRGLYTVGLSSGTSGNKLVTVLSPGERWQYGSLLWARSGIPDGLKTQRVLFALRVNNPAFMEARMLGATMIYVDYTHTPEDLARLINEKQLNILAGPPSLLRMIGRLSERIDHPIDGVISYAEVLDDAARLELRHAFQAPVAEIYQGAEGFIGSTCREGRLHINEDVVLVEALEAGDTAGRARQVVVTDLYRKTLPFLRYGINDVIEIAETPCPCGSCFRVIERIHGRADDIFLLKGAGDQPRYLFPDYVTRSINQASDDIAEFQAIQHSLEDIEVRLLVKPGANRASIEAAVRANLAYWAERAGGALGALRFSGAPPERNPNSQKLIRVVRKWTL